MKLNFFILLVLFSITTPVFSQEEILTLKTPVGDLEGTLLLPEQKQNIPLVILIAGSGPTDRNGNQGELENNSLKMLATGLAESGIASLRYDKRGVGQSADSKMDEMEMRFDDFVQDVKRWIDYMAYDKRFSGIIVAGHSEGSLVGMLASAGNPKVNAFVSIAGAGRPADELLKEQLEIMPEKMRDIVFPMIDRVKKGDTITNVPTIYYPILRPSVQPYMRSWFKYDPRKEIQKLKIPVLIVQGSTDLQVKVKDAELLAEAQPKARKEIINNMNHVLKTVESMSRADQKATYTDGKIPINPDCLTVISDFITKIPRTKSGKK